ncbi:hypothetical protein Nepgr_023602 [Nepenthes gracilis]|uniref:Protein TILLER ANGLE CONTROL 1 n=1 Tax=Nepenthes gracilis TaxID=150966 RepID=A0AAD3T2R0_NEPGR|nr:hypothetical protein Nepgr_023602 [Nepenthes gracilis]
MKIFSWVHRRLSQNFNSTAISCHEDGLAIRSKKAQSKYDKDNETEGLLEHSNITVDVLENWKLDDILSIGTLAITPSADLVGQNEVTNEEDDNEKNKYCVENEPIVYEEGGDLNSQTLEFNSMFEDNIEMSAIYRQDLRNAARCNDIETVDDIVEWDNKKEKKNEERVTLAQLFMADSNGKRMAEPEDLKAFCAKKQAASRAKKGLSKAKRLLPHVKEDLRPLKKMQQFMTRIVRNKIHPDLDVKVMKKDSQMKTMKATGGKDGANESVPLLHIKGAFPRALLLDGLLVSS